MVGFKRVLGCQNLLKIGVARLLISEPHSCPLLVGAGLCLHLLAVWGGKLLVIRLVKQTLVAHLSLAWSFLLRHASLLRAKHELVHLPAHRFALVRLVDSHVARGGHRFLGNLRCASHDFEARFTLVNLRRQLLDLFCFRKILEAGWVLLYRAFERVFAAIVVGILERVSCLFVHKLISPRFRSAVPSFGCQPFFSSGPDAGRVAFLLERGSGEPLGSSVV